MANNKIITESYQNREKVLKVNNLRVSFKSDSGLVYAVRGVSFDLYKGETLCIVGESGSGKSVTSKTIMGILPNNAIIENGQIMYEGEDLVRVSEEEFHRIRGHKIGMIFQDPLSSLNPIMKVGKQITEATMINNDILKKKYNEQIAKELVAYRNNKANYIYEANNAKSEIEYLKGLLEEYKKELKLQAKGKFEIEEDEETAVDKINDHFKKIENVNNLLLESLNHQLEKFTKKLEEVDPEDTLNIDILNLRIENLNSTIEAISGFKDNEEDDPLLRVNTRISFLHEFVKLHKKIYSSIKPLLKTALKGAKAVAKKDIDAYANALKSKKDADIAELEEQLDALENEFREYIDTLSIENPTLLEEINAVIAKNDATRKEAAKAAKRNYEVNISNVAVASNVEILPIPDEHYASLVERREAILNNIEEVKEEYINKTKITKAEAKRRALEVMKEVGIPLPERRYKQYPFEFSGGMRQRIVIAIALTANPDILICDEPTTALDVTIQAQILELINKLKVERGLSCIFITHDLGVVANMADRVAVMYAGKIVEYGQAEEIFFDPKHPYTWALLSSIPDIDSNEKLEAIPGTPPDLRFPPKGDAFALRSKYAMAIDFKYEPPYFKISDTHYAATWLLHEDAPKVEMPKIVQKRINLALKEDNAND